MEVRTFLSRTELGFFFGSRRSNAPGGSLGAIHEFDELSGEFIPHHICGSPILGGPGSFAFADFCVDPSCIDVVALGKEVTDRKKDIRRLSTEALAATLRGESSTWPDGMARRMLLHPEGDPLQGALLGTHPLLREALREALDTDEHRQVAYHTAFHESVAGTPGTLAVSDTGSLRLRGAPLWRVRIEGHTAPALTLWLEMAPKRSPRLQAFVDFAAGAQGRTLVAELGYEVPR